MSEAKLKGVVKWFKDDKGYGFIVHSSGQDVFVHFTSIVQNGYKTLRGGDEVEYELTQSEKGLHAKNVTKISPQKIEKVVESESPWMPPAGAIPNSKPIQP